MEGFKGANAKQSDCIPVCSCDQDSVHELLIALQVSRSVNNPAASSSWVECVSLIIFDVKI